MKEFIHTFSFITHLHLAEKDILQSTFKEEFFYNSKEQHFVLSKYAERGLRMEMKFNPKKEKRYDKKHRDYKIEWIINPAKLLYPNTTMKNLYTAEEYHSACEALKLLLNEIETLSGISLWNEVKIHRIDVAKDVETPSDEYSKEVIRLAKKSLYKTGYHLWIPIPEDVEQTGWEEPDSTLFCNHHQGVNSKIYNKLTDLKNHKQDTSHISGLLRFELSLKRDYLKNYTLLKTNFLSFEELPELLCKILDQAKDIMQNYMIKPLWHGHFLSKKLQKKYIRIHCKTKKQKLQKMLDFRKQCNREGIRYDGKLLSYFSEIALSPLYITDEFQYIPSFASLLGSEEDAKIKRFSQNHINK